MSNMSTDVRNYFQLDRLIARSHIILRQLFKNRYSLFTNGQVWDDSSACGKNYFTNVIRKNKKFNLTRIQQILISDGNSNKWDLTTLTTLLINANHPTSLNTVQVKQLNNENALLIELRDIRNMLAHHKSNRITDSEFNQLWTKLSTILIAFGDIDNELEKLKVDNVFELPTQLIIKDNEKEAMRLNSLGTQAHKDGKFSEAITSFTKATVLPGVLEHDRAVFFSNLSSSRLALFEQQLGLSGKFEVNDATDQRYHALLDAKQARMLWPTWWKGHLRVGKVYAALNEHEKAINSFERALALAPTNNEIRKALDESHQIHGRQSRQEHLDPRLQPAMVAETLNKLNQAIGIDPQQIRTVHSLLETVDPPAADVVKGHKYEHGDNDIKQDYEQAAKYFAKAARQGNAEGMYNLARLTDRGLGVKKDHHMAFKLYEQAAAQPPEHPKIRNIPNVGVAQAEHSLGLKYYEGVGVHKNLSIAADWYQRAIDHGSAESANNLALMYEYGNGVDRNLDKAEQLFELSARRGDPNAMKNLAYLLIDKNNIEMAKTWYDRACEAGNVLAQTEREHFYSLVHKKEQFQGQSPLNFFYNSNEVTELCDSNKTNDNAHMRDFDLLFEYAQRGSLTAQRISMAGVHFNQALDILEQSKSLTEAQENEFIHELAQSYRIDRMVAKMQTIDIHKKVEYVIDRVLKRCSIESNDSIVSQLDEDVRTCYATLHMDSHKLILKFLGQCKQKYPQSLYFCDLSAFLNFSLNNYEASLYDINTGLALDSSDCELLCQKAMVMAVLNEDLDKIIEAYQHFLAVAPKDHPEVPEVYYAMAMCYLIPDKRKASIDTAKKAFKQGEEAEKMQLPCFQPGQYQSKRPVERILNEKSLSTAESIPSSNRKGRLTHPHRIEVIKRHRQWAVEKAQLDDYSNGTKINSTLKPRLKQQTAKSLVGLKSISLKEMNPRNDHVYNGYVISLIVIEETYSWTPSIHLVVEDENLDCEQMCIYGFPPVQGEYLIKEVFKIGHKMNVINPYLRIGAYDMKPMIRVDDFSSIIMKDESDKVINMCRCCGEPDALHVCAKCKIARYCSKECQSIDWKFYEHKLLCKK